MKKIISLLIISLFIGCRKDTPVLEKEKNLPKKDPLITWEIPPVIILGTPLSAMQLNATADVPGTFVYNPTLGTKLNVGKSQDIKVEFKPVDDLNYNSVTKIVKIEVVPDKIFDIDGNVYHTIAIGSQVWLIENLKTTKYRNGNPILKITDNIEWTNTETGAYCSYNNDASNDKYGKLYNLWASRKYTNHEITPEGWHIPTITEISTLIKYVEKNHKNSGTISKALASNSDWVFANNKLAIGYDLTANNSTGFTALPTGYRAITGPFFGKGEICYFWLTPLSFGSTDIWYCVMQNNGITIEASYQSSDKLFNNGYSVRCIKD